MKILNSTNEVIHTIKETGLQLCKINVNEDYRKEWNIHQNDFLCLTKNGELVSNNLYRVGGLGIPNFEKDRYFMIIKYVEAIYDFDFIKKIYPNDSKKQLESKRKHLEGRWTIFDANGVEKYEYDKGIGYPSIISESCVFVIENKYFNIETKELYCKSYDRMESSDFIFLDNAYDDDKSRRGIMKINKKDGSFEIFPKK